MNFFKTLIVICISLWKWGVTFAQNPICYVCSDGGISTITKPDVVVPLPESTGQSEATCEVIRLSAEILLLIPEESCSMLDREDFRILCGCENALNITQHPSAAPIAIPAPTVAPITPSPITPSPITPSPITALPILDPTNIPTITPSAIPTIKPIATSSPVTSIPSSTPTKNPVSDQPSSTPSDAPSDFPSGTPSTYPSSEPTFTPSYIPTNKPSYAPSFEKTDTPSSGPIDAPSRSPIRAPSSLPTISPSVLDNGSNEESVPTGTSGSILKNFLDSIFGAN